MHAIDRIFRDRQQLDRPSSFPQSVLFSSQSCIDEAEHTYCGTVTRLRLHKLRLLRPRRGKGRARLRFVFRHARNQALTEVAVELHCVAAEEIFAQRCQSIASRSSVALRQRTEEPVIRDILNCGGVFFRTESIV